MSSILRFKQLQSHLVEREAQYKREALIQARERAQGDRVAMLTELNDLVRNSGNSIALICRETGLSRSTVYRWLEDYDRLSTYVEGESAPGWTNVRLMPTGEVVATDRAGDQWVLEGGGEARNKTQNVKKDSPADWPDGAKDAYDSDQPTE